MLRITIIITIIISNNNNHLQRDLWWQSRRKVNTISRVLTVEGETKWHGAYDDEANGVWDGRGPTFSNLTLLQRLTQEGQGETHPLRFQHDASQIMTRVAPTFTNRYQEVQTNEVVDDEVDDPPLYSLPHRPNPSATRHFALCTRMTVSTSVRFLCLCFIDLSRYNALSFRGIFGRCMMGYRNTSLINQGHRIVSYSCGIEYYLDIPFRFYGPY